MRPTVETRLRKERAVGLPRGKSIALTPARRLMCDLMRASRRVPLVAVERDFRLGELAAARRAVHPHLSWFALFVKAWALVAERRDELRRSYLALPWPRLHQHACNVASIAIARDLHGEAVVLPVQIRCPERLPLVEIDAYIRRCRTDPVESVGVFRRQLRIGRLPAFLRTLLWRTCLEVSGNWRSRYAGTFGVTGVGALGSSLLNVLSPLTVTLTYGAFAADGSVVVRLFYDHRVLDGVQPANALQDLETILCGPIRDELRDASRRAA